MNSSLILMENCWCVRATASESEHHFSSATLSELNVGVNGFFVTARLRIPRFKLSDGRGRRHLGQILGVFILNVCPAS